MLTCKSELHLKSRKVVKNLGNIDVFECFNNGTLCQSVARFSYTEYWLLYHQCNQHSVNDLPSQIYQLVMIIVVIYGMSQTRLITMNQSSRANVRKFHFRTKHRIRTPITAIARQTHEAVLNCWLWSSICWPSVPRVSSMYILPACSSWQKNVLFRVPTF